MNENPMAVLFTTRKKSQRPFLFRFATEVLIQTAYHGDYAVVRNVSFIPAFQRLHYCHDAASRRGFLTKEKPPSGFLLWL